MLSTATMIRLGYVTGNRMTNMSARNEKLHARALRIFQAETGLDEQAAQAAFNAAGNDLRVALVMHRTGRTRVEAEGALASSQGVVGQAIEQLLQSGEHLS
jgi:N-acetylmuramic acid 6-phosphate etherase